MDGFGGIDFYEILRRILKYITMGIAIAFCSIFLLKNRINLQEILVLSLTVASLFAVLDLYAPAVSSSAKWGVGAGLGISAII